MKLIIFTFLITNFSFAACLVGGSVSKNLQDPLFGLLQSPGCPQNVHELKQLLKTENLKVESAMVANRGRHNPAFGSFSLFETVSGILKSSGKRVNKGEFFFGHFTTNKNGLVDFDQAPRPGKLLIELIVWDEKKEMFNFYELIGKTGGADWFYRGDSADAIKDNLNLHLQENADNPKFGRTMRCSACHTSGTPIMKEITAPHNDWWTKQRPLPFAPNKPSQKLSEVELMDATAFAEEVKLGIAKVVESESYKKALNQANLQQKLKPLFCTNEINLISDGSALSSPKTELEVSSEFWINPLLAKSESIVLSKALYIELLEQFNFGFPETSRLDADHGFLVPVKGHSDLALIEELIKDKVVSEELVSDILAIDMTKPMFSTKRCALLQFVPEDAKNWEESFVANLESSSSSTAKDLLENINDESRSAAFHEEKAAKFLKNQQGPIDEVNFVQNAIVKMHNDRISVFNNEISQNPLGQILEPGFRVIFPMPN